MNGVAEPVVDGSSSISENPQFLSPTLSPISERLSEQINEQIIEEPKTPTNGPLHTSLDGTNRDDNLPRIFATNGESDLKMAATRQTGGQEKRKRSVGKLSSPVAGHTDREKVLKLSPAQIQELTSSPHSLPLRAASPLPEEASPLTDSSNASTKDSVHANRELVDKPEDGQLRNGKPQPNGTTKQTSKAVDGLLMTGTPSFQLVPAVTKANRPALNPRTVSTPSDLRRRRSSTKGPSYTQTPDPLSQQRAARHAPLKLNTEDIKDASKEATTSLKPTPSQDAVPSPLPKSLPLPPFSLPTYLQLELASERPSPLYIYRSATNDFPYESSQIKFERLLNFLLLPLHLERILWFGALACLDAWLYTFTILPLRFFKALGILAHWWSHNAVKEIVDLASFVYFGLGRLWQRRGQKGDISTLNTPSEEGSRSRSQSFSTAVPQSSSSRDHTSHSASESSRKHSKRSYKHRRTKSTPSSLQPAHKADILKGLLVIVSCMVLMRFDASRMYHGIRGQAAIKLYVIYNVLEVCDRLFSALGQDVLECLFSRETLERNSDGRSKIIRPFWMFLLALGYNIIHSTSLFYQVITLNVAVNSYSNALLTLLMSNQFVEIKGTVFKKFEKENLFQITCADIVERFQLWLMLMIIVLRNIVELGGLSISLAEPQVPSGAARLGSNATSTPFRSTSIMPKSFTIFPKWTGQVFGPFLLVLGSEMIVDGLKHAYITKFNNTKPTVYGRFLDVLAKDYYSHAFADQNLTKRIGLPVIPLTCLFIRAVVQSYHMFLATHMPLPIPSTATSLSTESAATTSPSTTAVLEKIDHLFRRALGRSSFGAGVNGTDGSGFSWWSVDDVIAFLTMVFVFLVAWLILLAFKLVLGILLLSYSRSRYKGMKERERQVTDTGGKRIGGWGIVEVGDDKRGWIYADDPEGLKNIRDRAARQKEKDGKSGDNLWGVSRYQMAAKRIW